MLYTHVIQWNVYKQIFHLGVIVVSMYTSHLSKRACTKYSFTFVHSVDIVPSTLFRHAVLCNCTFSKSLEVALGLVRRSYIALLLAYPSL